MISCVSWSVEPSGVSTSHMITPWSSWGTRPEGRIFMNSTNSTTAPANSTKDTHGRFRNFCTAPLYLLRIAVKLASYATFV